MKDGASSSIYRAGRHLPRNIDVAQQGGKDSLSPCLLSLLINFELSHLTDPLLAEGGAELGLTRVAAR